MRWSSVVACVDDNGVQDMVALRDRLDAPSPEVVRVLVNNAIHPGERGECVPGLGGRWLSQMHRTIRCVMPLGSLCHSTMWALLAETAAPGPTKTARGLRISRAMHRLDLNQDFVRWTAAMPSHVVYMRSTPMSSWTPIVQWGGLSVHHDVDTTNLTRPVLWLGLSCVNNGARAVRGMRDKGWPWCPTSIPWEKPRKTASLPSLKPGTARDTPRFGTLGFPGPLLSVRRPRAGHPCLSGFSLTG